MTVTELPAIGNRQSEIEQRSSITAALVQLTKPRITVMVVLTTLIGFMAAAPSAAGALVMWQTVVATGLVAAAASAVNQIMEREPDGRMRRTEKRPLPAGKVTTLQASLFASALLLAGTVWLWASSNLLCASLAFLTFLSYVAIYTPLKSRTWLATLVGAVPGAIPPMIGWAAARGSLGIEPVILFMIMFAWQMPHFFAIAALYRDDYRRGGFRVLPVIEPDGRSTGRQSVLWALALLPLSMLPAFAGMTATWYLVPATALGLWFLGATVRFMRAPADTGAARALFRLSLLYLPAVFLLIVLI